MLSNARGGGRVGAKDAGKQLSDSMVGKGQPTTTRCEGGQHGGGSQHNGGEETAWWEKRLLSWLGPRGRAYENHIAEEGKA